MVNQMRRDALYDLANAKRYAAEGLAVVGIGCAGAAVWLYLRGRHRAASGTSAQHVIVSPRGVAIEAQFR
jgi:hypothetical protein